MSLKAQLQNISVKPQVLFFFLKIYFIIYLFI